MEKEAKLEPAHRGHTTGIRLFSLVHAAVLSVSLEFSVAPRNQVPRAIRGSVPLSSFPF
jgi:hypothetical protein